MMSLKNVVFFLTFAFFCCLNITTEAKEITRHLKLFPTEIIDATGQFELETIYCYEIL